MAKDELHYRVLVFTDEGPVFVTGTSNDDGRHRYFWDKYGRPNAFGKEAAFNVVKRLTANGVIAYVVVAEDEIDYQGMNYEGGHFEWVANNAVAN